MQKMIMRLTQLFVYGVLISLFAVNSSNAETQKGKPTGGSLKGEQVSLNEQPKAGKHSTEEETSSDNKPKGDKPAGGVNALKNALQATPASGKGGPLYIKSDSLELNSKDRIFTYKGNVEVVRDDVTITAALVEGQYDTQNRIETILCKKDVVITKSDGMKATANRALYRVSAGTIELTEGPELFREGNALQADKITVFMNEDRSEAEGNVRVKVIKPADANNS